MAFYLVKLKLSAIAVPAMGFKGFRVVLLSATYKSYVFPQLLLLSNSYTPWLPIKWYIAIDEAGAVSKSSLLAMLSRAAQYKYSTYVPP